jgi:hypothetical protein
MMVYNTKNYRVFGIFPTTRQWKKSKNPVILCESFSYFYLNLVLFAHKSDSCLFQNSLLKFTKTHCVQTKELVPQKGSCKWGEREGKGEQLYGTGEGDKYQYA